MIPNKLKEAKIDSVSLFERKVYRCFVGTMFCCENEFEDMKLSVQAQKNIKIAHCIVKDREELQAHQELYATWEACKDNFDLFVQIDADMVLAHENALCEAANLLMNSVERGNNSIVCFLHDWMMNDLVQGMRFSHKSVVFNKPSNLLFPDRCNVPIGYSGSPPATTRVLMLSHIVTIQVFCSRFVMDCTGG